MRSRIPSEDIRFVYALGQYKDSKSLQGRINWTAQLLNADWSQLGRVTTPIVSPTIMTARVSDVINKIAEMPESGNPIKGSHSLRIDLRALANLYAIDIATSSPQDADYEKKIATGKSFNYWQEQIADLRGDVEGDIAVPAGLITAMKSFVARTNPSTGIN
ncbi:MAG: hypothetical protein WCO06_07480 [Candidatus Roizmanbacteria bacterium]